MDLFGRRKKTSDSQYTFQSLRDSLEPQTLELVVGRIASLSPFIQLPAKRKKELSSPQSGIVPDELHLLILNDLDRVSKTYSKEMFRILIAAYLALDEESASSWAPASKKGIPAINGNPHVGGMARVRDYFCKYCRDGKIAASLYPEGIIFSLGEDRLVVQYFNGIDSQRKHQIHTGEGPHDARTMSYLKEASHGLVQLNNCEIEELPESLFRPIWQMGNALAYFSCENRRRNERVKEATEAFSEFAVNGKQSTANEVVVAVKRLAQSWSITTENKRLDFVFSKVSSVIVADLEALWTATRWHQIEVDWAWHEVREALGVDRGKNGLGGFEVNPRIWVETVKIYEQQQAEALKRTEDARKLEIYESEKRDRDRVNEKRRKEPDRMLTRYGSGVEEFLPHSGGSFEPVMVRLKDGRIVEWD